ncbi:MAG: xanthine dehydrogenase family protein subunit M [Chloroflexi bacterium]|nr:xanthine dehydrogenase family protein subunit M [Chloroflexota bacterium]MBI1856549.1 xanthine dehydrogenase family protein subunit M [Chloroflexota bacterium]MBI3339689.1 xanthine dehydrogenase family protein subunit M [Chloroflexota bacterium]
MNPIKFLEPTDFSEASSLLDQYTDDAKIIAGGVSITLMLQQKLISPSVLISLGRVSNYDFIRHDQDGLHIGALTKLRDIERSDIVKKFCPALAHTFSVVGNVRVRNQATIGGNLSAADYAADPPSMLAALNARVQVQGPEKKREISLGKFFLGFYTTALESNEILTEVVIPNLSSSARAAYHKYTSISAEGRPCVAVGAVADFDADGKCLDLRIAVGAAVETPQRLNSAEAMARGQILTDELVAAIAEEYSLRLDPLTDVRGSAWYRKEMIRVFVKRALQEVRNDR